MTLELSTRERDYIAKLLEAAYKEIRQEIHHTHTSTFKDELKLDEEMVRQLLEKVKALTA